MKKNFSEMMNQMDARELDELLDGVHAEPLEPAAVHRIGQQALAASGLKKRTRIRWQAIVAAAACLALLLGVGGYAYAAEVKEYNNAIQFFNEYDLSTEGLTRGEIKAVYRDITTESFTYSKTAEVIERSLSADQVGGYEIPQDDPSPEDIAALWDFKKFGSILAAEKASAQYSFSTDLLSDGMTLDKSYLEKYDNGKLLWRASVTEFSINGYSIVSDGVIAYGNTLSWSTGQISVPWMAKIDEDGNIIWKRPLVANNADEYIAAILENDDGSYAVISRRGLYYFCLSQYTADGERTHFQMTEVGNYGIWNAARLSDGYIVQLGSYMTGEHAKLIKVDYEGNITDSFSYFDEEYHYFIEDMIEFNGNVYLSVYAVPKRADDPDDFYNSHSEIKAILDYVFSLENWNISSEELTPLVRDNYTAMLLICDPDSGTPKEFFSVAGSLGGPLALDAKGNLLWDVHSITSTFFSPATSAYTIAGSCDVFRYCFYADSSLMHQEKTGEIVAFYR